MPEKKSEKKTFGNIVKASSDAINLEERKAALLKLAKRAESESNTEEGSLRNNFFNEFAEYFSSALKIGDQIIDDKAVYTSSSATKVEVLKDQLPILGNVRRKGSIYGTGESFQAKIVICGDLNTGKTAIRNTFLGHGFSALYNPTMGAEFDIKDLIVNYGAPTSVKFQIWDLSGDQRFMDLRPKYFKGASAAILVFDCNQPTTFINYVNWMLECWAYAGKPIPFVLLGNKQDLTMNNKEREDHFLTDDFIQQQIKTFSDECVHERGFRLEYYPTSARTGLNIVTAFKSLAQVILEWQDYLEGQAAKLKDDKRPMISSILKKLGL